MPSVKAGKEKKPVPLGAGGALGGFSLKPDKWKAQGFSFSRKIYKKYGVYKRTIQTVNYLKVQSF